MVTERSLAHGSRILSDVLGLTKMNWDNDGLYDRLPVTLYYAQVLAKTVRRMPQIESRPYQFRYFM